jgi:aconitase A
MRDQLRLRQQMEDFSLPRRIWTAGRLYLTMRLILRHIRAAYTRVCERATQQPLIYGPNIKDWPELGALTENILLKVASKILDDVTTTDELIPSGETSSYRSILWGWRNLPFPDAIPAMLAEARRSLNGKNNVRRVTLANWRPFSHASSRLQVRKTRNHWRLRLAA